VDCSTGAFAWRQAVTTHFDDDERPRLPRGEDREAVVSASRSAQFLVAVHDHLRAELARVVHVVQQVASGQLSPGEGRAEVHDLGMQRTYRAVGSFCGGYCQVVAVHHGIEDQRLFPDLADADSRLRPVLDRLGHEHEVIHDVLVAVDRALVRLVRGEGARDATAPIGPTHLGPAAETAELLELVTRLETLLLSHLDYEESQLLEPIARSNLLI
jgi:Hemerythrin HHE cation binding domain